MSIRRIAFISSAALLGFGAASGPVALAGADTPPTAAAPSSGPTVTSSAGTFTVTLPGVGSLSFAIDPTNGVVSGLTVTPVDTSGFTTSAPMATSEGIQVVFTSATSTQVLQVEIHPGPSGPMVTAEVEFPDPSTGKTRDDTTPGGPPSNSSTGDAQSGPSGQSGQSGVRGESDSSSSGATTTVPPSTPLAPAPAGDSGASESGGRSSSSDGGSRSGTESHPTPGSAN